MSERELHLTISNVECLTNDVRRYTLTPSDNTILPDWEPGAHIDVLFNAGGEDIIRQYSLCSLPSEKKHWQFAVRLAADGRGGSAYIHRSFIIGDTIHVTPPRNNFPLVAANQYLFLAGGIGITPIIPMIAEANKKGIDWQLIYCGRTLTSMPFIDELTSQYPQRVKLHESSTRGILNLPDIIKQSGENSLLYCCGPASMIDAVNDCCASWPDGRLHYERFAAREMAPADENREFIVEFARSGISVNVPVDRTILDIAEEHGIDIESSCQEGVCGSCETRILAGIADHRDSVLSPKERIAGQSMMICVSRCRSAKLVLDV